MTIPLRYNVRSLLQRKTRTALTMMGIAAVIAVFVAMVSLATGMSASFENTGSDDNVVVLQKAAFSQSLSSVPRSSNDVIRYYPHVKRKGETTLASPDRG